MRPERLTVVDACLNNALQFRSGIVIGVKWRLAAPVHAKNIFPVYCLFISLVPSCFQISLHEEASSTPGAPSVCASVSVWHNGALIYLISCYVR